MTRERRLSWINGLLLPFLNVLTAFIATAIVFILIGVDPIKATKILIYGALGYAVVLRYSLGYPSNFVCPGCGLRLTCITGRLIIDLDGHA